VLRVEVATGRTSLLALPAGCNAKQAAKWLGSLVAGSDGALYCAPCDTDLGVLRVDVAAGSTSLLALPAGCDAKQDDKWLGSLVAGSDGALYCAPYCAAGVLRLPNLAPGAAAPASPIATTAAAPEPEPATEEAEPPAIDAWLAGIGLSKYTAQIKEYGYDQMLVLHKATEADIVEMTEDADVKMKKPHRRVFVAEWKELCAARQQQQSSEPEPEPESESEPEQQEPQQQVVVAVEESHGKPIIPTLAADLTFHLVFSNKTAWDALCLEVRGRLVADGVRIWQQRTNIPKDSDNWFSEWYPSATKSKKIVCFISADYLRSPYCMKEWRVAEAKSKLLVVACEPLSHIMAVDPSEYPHASNALAYLDGGGQVIFNGQDDIVAEIRKFL
jgi:hypothetical protein